MIRTLPLLVYLLCIVSFAFTQQFKKEEIVGSGKYYYGTGISQDENQAREEALTEICEMIAVNVHSKFELAVSEENDDYNEKATSLIQTYASGSIRDVESIWSPLPDGNIEIFSYISKTEVNAIFAERIKLVRRLKANADDNREKGNLSIAIQNYYFGLILMKSVPAERVSSENSDLLVDIPESITEILNNIHFSVLSDQIVSENERAIELYADYHDKPVSSLDFRFWDGNQFMGNRKVRDGVAVIKFFGSSLDFDDLKIHIQYQNYNARKQNPAVENLWDLVSHPQFDNFKIIELKEVKKITYNTPCSENIIFNSSANVPVQQKIRENSLVFIDFLENGNPNEILNVFGNDEFLNSKIAAYMKFNMPIPICFGGDAEINETRYGYEVRKIPVLHDYKSIHKQTTEFLVLDFDKEGWLVDFNLCLTDDLYKKFVKQAEYGNDWGNRQEIIKFIEKYRTAFFTRDIKTIDLMFADEALILIGRKIQPRKQGMNEINYAPFPGQPGYEQIQLTKQEYLTRQKQVFERQKDIAVDFSSFEIKKKNNAPGVYGVEMRQNYSSTTYADEGYLFLLIDFRDENPLIYIRAWQPNEWDTNNLINTSNFRIYK
ncbi:MAG: LPP20 family lipoprotein [Bacteroidales bacterium]|nr:LPP20 family lipoprotein [Bacteroidales bacterium]